MERLDQPLEVLVRLDVADVEHERRRAAGSARGRARRPRPAAATPEALVDGVVDDRRSCSAGMRQKRRMSRFEASDTVRTRRARRVAAPHERAGVDDGQPVRQVLREHQVDAVVDGHDRPAAARAAAARSAGVEQRHAARAAAPAGSRSARAASSCRRASTTGRKFAGPAPRARPRRRRGRAGRTRSSSSSRASCRSRFRM